MPVPNLLASAPGLAPHGFAFMLLERLPGCDLGAAISALSAGQRSAAARTVSGWQRNAATLPHAKTFGYCTGPGAPPPHTTWADVLWADLERAAHWLKSAPWFRDRYVQRTRKYLESMSPYWSNIQPVPHLPDTTTKNVIVHRGRVVGLIDVDEICYGDPLQTVGLTLTALKAHALSEDYVDTWCSAIGIDGDGRRAVSAYALLSCLTFMGETGQNFNRSEDAAPNPSVRQRLADMFEAFARPFEARSR